MKILLKVKHRTNLRSTKVIIVFLLIAVFVVTLIILSQFSKKPESKSISEEQILFGTQPSALYQFGQTGYLGDLEISVTEAKEGNYLESKPALMPDSLVSYLAFYVKVFNFSDNKTEPLIIGLQDNFGNQFRPNTIIPIFVPSLRDFGRNRLIFPRIIQEGYLFFTDVNPEAKEFNLIFALKDSQEKIAFIIERSDFELLSP